MASTTSKQAQGKKASRTTTGKAPEKVIEANKKILETTSLNKETFKSDLDKAFIGYVLVNFFHGVHKNTPITVKNQFQRPLNESNVNGLRRKFEQGMHNQRLENAITILISGRQLDPECLTLQSVGPFKPAEWLNIEGNSTMQIIDGHHRLAALEKHLASDMKIYNAAMHLKDTVNEEDRAQYQEQAEEASKRMTEHSTWLCKVYDHDKIQSLKTKDTTELELHVSCNNSATPTPNTEGHIYMLLCHFWDRSNNPEDRKLLKAYASSLMGGAKNSDISKILSHGIDIMDTLSPWFKHPQFRPTLPPSLLTKLHTHCWGIYQHYIQSQSSIFKFLASKAPLPASLDPSPSPHSQVFPSWTIHQTMSSEDAPPHSPQILQLLLQASQEGYLAYIQPHSATWFHKHHQKPWVDYLDFIINEVQKHLTPSPSVHPLPSVLSTNHTPWLPIDLTPTILFTAEDRELKDLLVSKLQALKTHFWHQGPGLLPEAASPNPLLCSGFAEDLMAALLGIDDFVFLFCTFVIPGLGSNNTSKLSKSTANVKFTSSSGGLQMALMFWMHFKHPEWHKSNMEELLKKQGLQTHTPESGSFYASQAFNSLISILLKNQHLLLPLAGEALGITKSYPTLKGDLPAVPQYKEAMDKMMSPPPKEKGKRQRNRSQAREAPEGEGEGKTYGSWMHQWAKGVRENQGRSLARRLEDLYKLAQKTQEKSRTRDIGECMVALCQGMEKVPWNWGISSDFKKYIKSFLEQMCLQHLFLKRVLLQHLETNPPLKSLFALGIHTIHSTPGLQHMPIWVKWQHWESTNWVHPILSNPYTAQELEQQRIERNLEEEVKQHFNHFLRALAPLMSVEMVKVEKDSEAGEEEEEEEGEEGSDSEEEGSEHQEDRGKTLKGEDGKGQTQDGARSSVEVIEKEEGIRKGYRRVVAKVDEGRIKAIGKVHKRRTELFLDHRAADIMQDAFGRLWAVAKEHIRRRGSAVNPKGPEIHFSPVFKDQQYRVPKGFVEWPHKAHTSEMLHLFGLEVTEENLEMWKRPEAVDEEEDETQEREGGQGGSCQKEGTMQRVFGGEEEGQGQEGIEGRSTVDDENLKQLEDGDMAMEGEGEEEKGEDSSVDAEGITDMEVDEDVASVSVPSRSTSTAGNSQEEEVELPRSQFLKQASRKRARAEEEDGLDSENEGKRMKGRLVEIISKGKGTSRPTRSTSKKAGGI